MTGAPAGGIKGEGGNRRAQASGRKQEAGCNQGTDCHQAANRNRAHGRVRPASGAQAFSGCVRNGAFLAYARCYDDIRADFIQAIQEYGLPVAPGGENPCEGRLAAKIDALAARGLHVENDRKSFWVNWISPSCTACRRGQGTETFLTSTQCPRNCYFCFNPNQEGYEYYLSHVNDVEGELEHRHAEGRTYGHLALTGGEPLLHKDRATAFFVRAKELYPDARCRLYTSGSGLDAACLEALADAGLDEIRFSIKLEDSPAQIEATLRKMEMCQGAIGDVMVEMPVMPDQIDEMKSLLKRLDSIGISGINLLELCFPLYNAAEFARRGYALKPLPYRVLYNYWYAGGLPIEGSEQACIDLLEYALDEGLRMGVHYCSLENKVTGQVYQQNRPFATSFANWTFSQRDFFLKTAKLFGPDAEAAAHALQAVGERRFARDEDFGFIEVSPQALESIAPMFQDMTAGISYAVVEMRDGAPALRELDIKPVRLGDFRLEDL